MLNLMVMSNRSQYVELEIVVSRPGVYNHHRSYKWSIYPLRFYMIWSHVKFKLDYPTSLCCREFDSLQEMLFSVILQSHFGDQKFKILSMTTKKCVLLQLFNHQKFIFKQNQCHIRNQHQKLSQTTYVL